uniref:Uncharacterized protein n=1 Tax=Anguilla anguilla TaxID=7936 RepID=A0A0E9QQ17_ANGAN
MQLTIDDGQLRHPSYPGKYMGLKKM